MILHGCSSFLESYAVLAPCYDPKRFGAEKQVRLLWDPSAGPNRPLGQEEQAVVPNISWVKKGLCSEINVGALGFL